jgi:hypothetical protein
MITKFRYTLGQSVIETLDITTIPNGVPYETIIITDEEIQEQQNAEIQIEKDLQDEQHILETERQGTDLVLQHKKRLKRRVANKTTSEENAKEVRKLLRPIWQELKEGDFDWALEDLQGIDQSKLNVEIKREINWLINQL